MKINGEAEKHPKIVLILIELLWLKGKDFFRNVPMICVLFVGTTWKFSPWDFVITPFVQFVPSGQGSYAQQMTVPFVDKTCL